MATAKFLQRVATSDVFTLTEDDSGVFFEAGLSIDADGAYRAYHPSPGQGLDHIGNAGRPGNWWALVTDTGEPSGKPVIQKDTDPAPGHYIAMTSLADKAKKRTDPTRYVDAESVPYFVLPSNARFGLKLGDLGVAVNTKTWQCSGCVFADVGPKDKIGEGSIALAEAIGVPGNPRHGGASGGIAYVVFPGSGQGWPLSASEITTAAERRFEEWGGLTLLQQVLPAH